jgi:hypothetical protein
MRAHAERDVSPQDRVALRASVGLGLAVAAYLVGLLATLSALDAFVMTWWAVGAAALAALLPLAFAFGWHRSAHVGELMERRMGVGAGVALLAATFAVPAAFAVAAEQPGMARLSPRTEALAANYRDHAPMPPSVRRLQATARRAGERSASAGERAQAAASDYHLATSRATDATDDRDRAQRSLHHWTKETEHLQREYDHYQRLLDDVDPETGDDTGAGDPNDPLADVPPLDDLPAVPQDDTSPPTTGDFGTGQGSIGVCNDGTLSDSVGRPGACSHHGGVAG